MARTGHIVIVIMAVGIEVSLAMKHYSSSYADPLCLPTLCTDSQNKSMVQEKEWYLLSHCCSKQYLCSCNDIVCHANRTECAFTDNIISRKMEIIVRTHVECVSPQLRIPSTGSKFPGTFNEYFMNKECPESVFNENLIDFLVGVNVDKCNNAERYTEFDTRVPISDVRTGLTYINKYCAMCHGVTAEHMAFWTPEIDCAYDEFWPTGYDSIVEGIERTPDCNIIFRPPTSISMLTDCSTTVPEFCFIDKNITCYADTTWEEIMCHLPLNICPPDLWSHKVDPLLPPFSLILGYGAPEGNYKPVPPVEVRKDIMCDEDTFHDTLKNVCRNLTCLQPRTLLKGKCETLMQSMKGFSFKFSLKMTPKQYIPMTKLESVSDKVTTFVKDFLQVHRVTSYSFRLYQHFTTTNEQAHSEVSLGYYAIVVEAGAFDTYIDAAFIDAVLELEQCYLNVTEYIFYTQLIEGKHNSDGTVMFNFVENDILTTHRPYEMLISISKSDVSPRAFNLMPTSGCPLLSIKSTEYKMIHFIWGVHIQDIQANISHWDLIEKFDAGKLISITICADSYANLIEPFIDPNNSTYTDSSNSSETMMSHDRMINAPRQSNSPDSLRVGVLSFVCTCLSIVCLLLTLLTYGLFRDMRTQPGVNNMALCVSLILAQTMFQFGIGQKDNVPRWACEAIGILVHFFWLNAIMWMNISSIHSCRVFWGIAKIQNSNYSLKTTAVYFTYASICAVLPVTANILYNVHSNISTLGYGKVICYLSEKEYIWWTFALPTAVFILINILLLAVIVIKVNRIPHLSAYASKGRHYLKVYARLSCLTGCLWIFGFVYMFTDEIALQCLFIVFNASQGVFIFLALVCNKLCLRKYLGLCSKYAGPLVSTKVTDVKQ